MIYVDEAKVPRHGSLWCHLLADSITELHQFAALIGVSRRAFHRGARHPHYDITLRQRQIALREGASAVTSREAVRVARQMFPAKAEQFSLFA